MAGEDRLKAVSFAAGTAAFMACIERAVVVSVFVHWHVWVFLALNLLLLAILFTSKFQTQSDEVDHEEDGFNCNLDFKMKIKKRRKEYGTRVSGNCGGEMVAPPNGGCVECEMEKVENGGKKEDDDNDELSKDELNQRVEAFIAMFRQHLVYDAKGKRYCPDQRDSCVYLSHTAVKNIPPSDVA